MASSRIPSYETTLLPQEEIDILQAEFERGRDHKKIFYVLQRITNEVSNNVDLVLDPKATYNAQHIPVDDSHPKDTLVVHDETDMSALNLCAELLRNATHLTNVSARMLEVTRGIPGDDHDTAALLHSMRNRYNDAFWLLEYTLGPIDDYGPAIKDESALSLLHLLCDIRSHKLLFHHTKNPEKQTEHRALSILERHYRASPIFREKTKLRARLLNLIPVQRLSDAIVRLGYQTFLRTREGNIRDLWHHTANEYTTELLESQESTMNPESRPEENLQKLEPLLQEKDLIQKIAASFLKERDAPDVAQTIAEKIDIPAMKDQYDDLELQHQQCALAGHERAICASIWRELQLRDSVDRMVHDNPHNTDQQEAKNSPARVAVESSAFSCFSGVWAMASLMMEAGIPHEDILFCNISTADEGRWGPHCALYVTYSDGECELFDFGHRKAGRSFPRSAIKYAAQRTAVNDMTGSMAAFAKSKQLIAWAPEKITVDPEISTLLNIPEEMHVMPLDQGFAAFSFLNLGITLEHEGKIDEAMIAYELGLTSYPQSVDLLTHAARIHVNRNEREPARNLLTLALDACPHYPHTLYEMGRLELAHRNLQEAHSYFERVASHDPEKVWDQKDIVTAAKSSAETLEALIEQQP